ncbi:SDR family oxidoreductase [Mycobacterium sp. NPDC003449]
MTILVTGATGNIGRRVVDELIRLGGSDIGDIRALTTNPAKAALPESVTAITGYLGKPETLPAAFDGVERVYLAPLPATAQPTLELMVQAGVRYVVALSGGAHWAGAQWYLDLFEGDPDHQAANDNVARLTGTPAESMAQWAARNRGLFQSSGL